MSTWEKDYIKDLTNQINSRRSREKLSSVSFQEVSNNLSKWEDYAEGLGIDVNGLMTSYQDSYYQPSIVGSQETHSKGTTSQDNNYGLDPVNAAIQSALGIANFIFDVSSFAHNAYVNKRNYDHQLEVEKYNKDLQEKMFTREDTAYTRAAADLSNAGLSKTLLGSGAGAGTVVNYSAAQQSTDNGQVSFNSLIEILKTLQELEISKQQMYMQQKQTDASIELARQNAKLDREKFEFEKNSYDKTLSETKRRNSNSLLTSSLLLLKFLSKGF